MIDTPKISGFANTQTVAEIKCVWCGADPGQPCHTPQGRRLFVPHIQRFNSYCDKIGPEEFDRRHAV